MKRLLSALLLLSVLAVSPQAFAICGACEASADRSPESATALTGLVPPLPYPTVGLENEKREPDDLSSSMQVFLPVTLFTLGMFLCLSLLLLWKDAAVLVRGKVSQVRFLAGGGLAFLAASPFVATALLSAAALAFSIASAVKAKQLTRWWTALTILFVFLAGCGVFSLSLVIVMFSPITPAEAVLGGVLHPFW